MKREVVQRCSFLTLCNTSTAMWATWVSHQAAIKVIQTAYVAHPIASSSMEQRLNMIVDHCGQVRQLEFHRVGVSPTAGSKIPRVAIVKNRRHSIPARTA